MSDDWPQIRARLEVAAGTSSGHFDPQLPVYIRAALQRDRMLTDENGFLRQRVEELEGMLKVFDYNWHAETTNKLNEKDRADRAEAKLARVILILEDYAQDGGNPILLEHALEIMSGER